MQSISEITQKSEQLKRQDNCEHHGAFESVNYIGKIWSRCPRCATALAEMRKKQDEDAERER